MVRILRLINRLNLGGPAHNAAYLSRYLAPEFETILVSGDKDISEASAEFILKELGIIPIYIPEMRRSIHPYRDIIAYRRIKEIIKEFKPDIIHTHAAKAGALGRMAAFSCNVPVVVHTFHGHTFHSYFNPVIASIFVNIERYLAKRSTAIVTISEGQKIELCEKYRICELDKAKVIPLGFDLEKFQQNTDEKRVKFRNLFQIDEDEIAIGIIGRLVPIKNHELFLKGIRQLQSKSTKKVRAFIIGDGECRETIERAATEMNIDFVTNDQPFRRVFLTFTSWIKEIDEVILGLDIIALTSLNEGTPVSLIEAQAANKPIIASNVGGVIDTVIPDDTAIIFPSGDEKSLSGNLIKLVENETFRNEIGKKGYDFVKRKFAYVRLIEDMRLLYHDLLKK